MRSIDLHGQGKTPVLRFFCHCQICQALYQEPFADVTVFWSGAISGPAQVEIQYKKYRPPPALKRATCPACQSPLFGFMSLAPFLRLEFVTTRNFVDTADFPMPSAHIFYHRRKAEIQDSLPKISGNLASELAVTHDRVQIVQLALLGGAVFERFQLSLITGNMLLSCQNFGRLAVEFVHGGRVQIRLLFVALNFEFLLDNAQPGLNRRQEFADFLGIAREFLADLLAGMGRNQRILRSYPVPRTLPEA